MRKLILLIVVPMLVQAQTGSFLPDYDWLSLLCDPATTTLTDDVYLTTCGLEKPDLASSEDITPPLAAQPPPPSDPEPSEPATASTPTDDPPVTLELTGSEQWVARSGSVTISWQSTGATSCTASGDWFGSKPVEGMVHREALTEDETYMLTCGNDTDTAVAVVGVYVRQAVLFWEPPTANTDGSALSLADLDGYRVYWGSSSRTYENTLDVDDSTLRSLVLELTPGTYYFAMTAINTAGIESPFSAEGRKEIN